MRILVTNDDGIMAHGLIRLAEVAKKFGEVWVVAPDGERSAASHSVTLRHPLDVYPIKDFPVEGVKAFSCSGMPTDCVRVGSLSVMPEKPDIVLSGINKGFNLAADIQYSATAGAAFEAAFQGYHAIAVSEGFDEPHEVTDKYLEEILRKLINTPLPEGHIHNVNFPQCTLTECKGILFDRTVSPNMFYKDTYDPIEELPNGGIRYMIHGTPRPIAEEGSDFRAILDNYVSIGIVNNIGY
ncbi:MAG: 5'/3'-nucleotidase SurE [Lachnospiraceae bacterium]|nr:5'/3'-nucleotidase SurE [Lachnospiraceae bacterium]MBR4994025.1 5'/3'-nucleotidase SurE [Lachnospiraceae bacterium]